MIQQRLLSDYTHGQRRSMPKSTFQKILVNTLYAAYDDRSLYDQLLDLGSGHGEVHYGKSPEELADRLIEKNKYGRYISAATSFHSEEEAKEIILDALIYNSDKITDWYKGRLVDMGEDDYQRLTINLDMKTRDPFGIGDGLTSNFYEKVTDTVTVVLERARPGLDNKDFYNSPLGIYVQTAYPNIMLPEAKLTGRKFDPKELVQDRMDGKSSLEKAELLYRGKVGQMFLGYTPQDEKHPEHLYLNLKKPSFQFSAILAKKDTKLIIKDSTGAHRVNMFYLTQYHTGIARTVANLRNSIDRFEKGQTPSVPGEKFREQKRKGFKGPGE